MNLTKYLNFISLVFILVSCESNKESCGTNKKYQLCNKQTVCFQMNDSLEEVDFNKINRKDECVFMFINNNNTYINIHSSDIPVLDSNFYKSRDYVQNMFKPNKVYSSKFKNIENDEKTFLSISYTLNDSIINISHASVLLKSNEKECVNVFFDYKSSKINNSKVILKNMRLILRALIIENA